MSDAWYVSWLQQSYNLLPILFAVHLAKPITRWKINEDMFGKKVHRSLGEIRTINDTFNLKKRVNILLHHKLQILCRSTKSTIHMVTSEHVPSKKSDRIKVPWCCLVPFPTSHQWTGHHGRHSKIACNHALEPRKHCWHKGSS